MTEKRLTLIYDDVATEVSAQFEARDLWIESRDLVQATRFELKLQGVCRDELCYPLPQSGPREFLREEANKTWFNLTAFARLISQPVAHDAAHSAWYFGVRSDQQQQLASMQAPGFTLPDLDGKLHSLSDFHGKRVFLVTWASW